MNPFDVAKDISFSKKGLIDNTNEGEYTPFLVNRYFSLFPDTIFYINEVNRRSHLDNKLQHDYLMYSIRKSKRFSKWIKKDKSDIIEAIQKHFGYTPSKAKEALKLLSKEQINIIMKLQTEA